MAKGGGRKPSTKVAARRMAQNVGRTGKTAISRIKGTFKNLTGAKKGMERRLSRRKGSILSKYKPKGISKAQKAMAAKKGWLSRKSKYGKGGKGMFSGALGAASVFAVPVKGKSTASTRARRQAQQRNRSVTSVNKTSLYKRRGGGFRRRG